MLEFGILRHPRSVRWNSLLLVALALLLPTRVFAEITLTVTEVDPPTPAVLGKGAALYIRIGYDTDRAVRFGAATLFNGQRVGTIPSGQARHGPGKGETFFWFFYTVPKRLDTITVWANDAQSGQVVAQIEHAVDVVWTDAPAESRPEPEWVTRLKAAPVQLPPSDDPLDSGPLLWLGNFIFYGMYASVPLYFIVQGVALFRLRGGHRKAAAIVGAAMAVLVIVTTFAFLDESNLFPIYLLFGSPLALMFLVALLFTQRSRGTNATPTSRVPRP